MNDRRLRVTLTGRPTARTTLSWLLVASGALALVLIVTSTVLGLTMKDAGCTAACHAMAPYGEAVDEGPHATLACADCHAGEGAAAVIADGVAIQRRSIAALRGVEPSMATAADDACLRCHAGVTEGTMVARGIAVRHQDFLGTPCFTCHGATGHVLPGRVYSSPEMDDCMQCHSSSAREAVTCDRCHVPDGERERRAQKSTWRTVHGAKWETTHGLGDQDSCISCHRPVYCARCHGVALPHPESWSRDHGREWDPKRPETCTTCHQPSWCEGCHGVEMPHPPEFLPAHGRTAEGAGEQACRRCHATESCSECHLRSAHPDVPGASKMHSSESVR